jgi:hypothetical protein
LRLLRHSQAAPLMTSNTTVPPIVPPTIAPIFLFSLAGACKGVTVGATVGVGRTRVGVRGGNEATASKQLATL